MRSHASTAAANDACGTSSSPNGVPSATYFARTHVLHRAQSVRGHRAVAVAVDADADVDDFPERRRDRHGKHRGHRLRLVRVPREEVHHARPAAALGEALELHRGDDLGGGMRGGERGGRWTGGGGRDGTSARGGTDAPRTNRRRGATDGSIDATVRYSERSN
eukprot:29276-Pelagococcus_subviridis.AAC.2